MSAIDFDMLMERGKKQSANSALNKLGEKRKGKKKTVRSLRRSKKGEGSSARAPRNDDDLKVRKERKTKQRERLAHFLDRQSRGRRRKGEGAFISAIEQKKRDARDAGLLHRSRVKEGWFPIEATRTDGGKGG